MEILNEIDKNFAKIALYSRKSTYGFIVKTIDASDRVYKARFSNLAEFRNILLFPWNDWGVSYISKGRLECANSLHSMPLDKIALTYDEFSQKILEKDTELLESKIALENHSESIDHIKSKILERGYKDKKWNSLVLKENDKLYLIDGHHRMVSFMSLIHAGKVKYKNIKVIFAEFTNIESYIGEYNVLPRETWTKTNLGN